MCVDFIDEFVMQKYVPPEDVATMLFELIQGEGGYVVPPLDYFQRLNKLADKYALLIINDEVQSGKQGAYTSKRLGELEQRSEIVGDVRERSLMIGVELVEDKKSKRPAVRKATQVIMRALKRGVAVVTCGLSTIRIALPLTIQRIMLDAALEIVEDTISEVAKEA